MREIFFIFCFASLSLFLKAQIAFTTIVSPQQVEVGASFQVQYVIEGEINSENIKAPAFENFKFVTRHSSATSVVATGKGLQKVKKIIFTLKAIQPGKFIIHGASIVHAKKYFKSNDVFVQVITAREPIRKMSTKNGIFNINLFLHPSEDPYKKIKENLFIKVQVNKQTCYTGEPVLATFKLYSSLQSKSDIVKNPGFYGFSVFDMLNLSDKEVTTEKLNGKLFDVHTIRKVQLFPLRPGIFTIDPMEVKNRVEFFRSAVEKKTELEIVEGVLGNNDALEKSDAEYFESEINTEPLSIDVKPLPENNKPTDFNGAVGHFDITALLLNEKLGKNEEGMFEVIVKGTGNFIQLIAPVINWPLGVEAFDPSIKDNFDKTVSPLSGYRTFRFPFVCSTDGKKVIPVVRLSYFDIDSNRYKIISTKPVLFEISGEKKIPPSKEKKKNSITYINRSVNRIAGAVVVSLILIVLIYWASRKNEKILQTANTLVIRPDAKEVMKLAIASVNDTDAMFYKNLHQSIWVYLVEGFNLKGGIINKNQLLQMAKRKGIPEPIINELGYILSECETGQFAIITPSEDRVILLKSAVEVISSIEQYLL